MERETETEAETEIETETEAETEIETEMEAETESETEIDTESPSETVTETETEMETESETEGVIEETETETESETEDVMAEEAESQSIQVMSLAAQVKQLLVTASTKEGTPVEDAIWILKAYDDIVPAVNVTIPNTQGQRVSYEAGKTAFAKDQEIFRWTTGTSARDLTPYLIPGGSYYLEEYSVPDGYLNAANLYFTVDEDGNVKDAGGSTVTSLNIVYGEKTGTGQEQVLSMQLAVQDSEAGSDGKYAYLAGAQFVLKDSEGKVLTDQSGNPYIFSSGNGVMTLNLDPELYQALTADLANGGSRTFTVAEIQAPEGYRVDGYSEASIVITKNSSGEVSLTLDDRYAQQLEDGSQALIFQNRKIPDAGGTVSVTMRNYYGEEEIYATSGVTYYVALFSDKEKTNRISDVQMVSIEKGYKAATVRFENLPNGTYYVGETDQYGNLVGTVREQAQATDPFYARYLQNGQENDIAVIKTDEGILDADVVSVSIYNQYFEMSQGFTFTASFNVTMQLRDSTGAALNSTDTFYVGIYTKQANGSFSYIGRKSIRMGGNSSSTIKVELTMSTATKDVMVKEVDANGKEITSSNTYTTNISPSQITLNSGEKQQQTVTITKTRLASAETETESETADPNAGKARLKLTKRVTYKDTAIRVNSVYYIGIFDDPELTQLRYSRAMVMNDASELTASLLVNLDKTETGEVTFYFAEVDEEGNVLEGGRDFGYDIALNQNSVTLNSGNMEDEVVVTNDVVEGSNVASALADPASGLAGDDAALATAQGLASAANSSGNTQTGDDSPILPLIGLMGGCAAVIAVLAVIVVRKRRYRG